MLVYESIYESSLLHLVPICKMEKIKTLVIARDSKNVVRGSSYVQGLEDL